jgi:hypothetical protein
MGSRRSKLIIGTVTIGLFLLSTALPAGAASQPASIVTAPSRVVDQINGVRAAFGLPSGTLTHAYDALVIQAAVAQRDPSLPPLAATSPLEFGLWGLAPQSTSSARLTMQSIVSAWVYHDGWMGSQSQTWNLDCTSPSAEGCGGHRRAVLSRPPVQGEHLLIDVAAIPTTWQKSDSVSLAVLMVWTKVGPH